MARMSQAYRPDEDMSEAINDDMNNAQYMSQASRPDENALYMSQASRPNENAQYMSQASRPDENALYMRQARRPDGAKKKAPGGTKKKSQVEKLSKPSVDDLIIGRGKLKKTKAKYKPVKVGREIFNNEAYENILLNWSYDYLPLQHAKNALYTYLGSGDLVNLDLSGIDQMTDIFFKQIKEFNLTFPSLDKLNVSGCIYLTDLGIKWICSIFSTVKEVRLQGCRKLTEKSLYSLLKNSKQQGMIVDMKGTNVAMVPVHVTEEAKADVKIDGCPVISPTVDNYYKLSHQYASVGKTSTLKDWKVIAINPDLSTKYSLLTYLMTGKTQPISDPAPLLFWEKVSLDCGITIPGDFNMYEMEDFQAYTDMLFSEGCICLLPFDMATAIDNKASVINTLCGNILSIYSKCNNCVVVICGVILESEDGDALKKVFEEEFVTKIEEAITYHITLMDVNYSEMVRMEWMETSLDFPTQQYLGRLQNFSETLSDAINTPKLLFNTIHMKEEALEEFKMSGVKSWISAAGKCLPWQIVWGTEFVELYNEMKNKGKETCSEYHNKFSKKISWDLNISITSVRKGLEILQSWGLFTLIHRKNQNPIVLDNKSMKKILQTLDRPSESTGLKDDFYQLDVPSVGDGVPCWTRTSLYNALVLHLQPGEFPLKSLVESVMRFLEKENILMKLPVVASDLYDQEDHQQDNFVYVQWKHLPKEPLVDLEEFWPSKRPKTHLQLERFYYLHGMQKSFMAALFRHLSKLFRFTLLWQEGVFIQCGGIDLLVKYCRNIEIDTPVIVIAVRGIDNSTHTDDEQFPSQSLYTEQVKGLTEKPVVLLDNARISNVVQYMWSVLRLGTSIVDYVLQKNNIYAMVMVACKDCDPDQNINTMWRDPQINRLPLSTALNGIPHRTMRCKMKCHERAIEKGLKKADKFKTEDFHGPGSIKVITPRHNQTFLQKIRDADVYINYSRCFLCQNCADKHLECTGNKMNGTTSRNCSCDTKMSLCPQCGICQRCTAFMAKVETSLMPGLSSAEPFIFVDSKSKNPDNEQNTIKGNIVSCNSKAVLVAPIPMTAEQFNYFEITTLRGNNLVFGLAKSITESDIQDINDPGSKCLSLKYDLQKGIIQSPQLTSKRSNDYEGREGHTVGILLRKDDSDHINVEILYQGKHIYDAVYDASTTDALFPIINVVSPTAFIVNAPGMWSKRKNVERESRKLRIRQVVEYSMDQKQAICYLAFVSNVTASKSENAVTLKHLLSFNTIEDVLYSGSPDSLAIHPVGFHTTKGYKLMVRMPKYKGTTKEVIGYYNKQCKIGDPKFEKLLEDRILAEWDSFTELQTGGTVPHPSLYRSRLESECAQLNTYPSELYCGIAQLKNELHRLLFMQGDVSLSGAAGVLLPKSIPSYVSVALLQHFVCSNSMVKADKKFHPLCHVRTSGSEMMMLPSGYALSEIEEPYWLAHLVNGSGLALPDDVLVDFDTLLFAWHAYLSLQPKIMLPDVWDELFDRKFPVKSELVASWIQKCFEMLTHMTLANLPEKLSYSLPISNTFTLDTAVLAMREQVEKNYKSLGLIQVEQTLFLDDEQRNYLFLCQGHGNCTLKDLKHKENPSFPIERFNNYSKFIRSLEMTSSKLQVLQDDIFDFFPNLVHLDLSNNLLEKVPRGIGCCRNLRYLTLAYNNISDLPKEMSTLKDCLKRLDVSYNPMNKLPQVVTKLTNLRKLYIHDLFLEELPSDIGKLKLLELLSMNSSCIKMLPKTFKKLKKATHVVLNGVAWLEAKFGLPLISIEVYKQKHFQRWFKEKNVDQNELFCNGNEPLGDHIEQSVVSKVNAKIYQQFPRLGTSLVAEGESYNLNVQFPREILVLYNLEYLSLQYQGIYSIPPQISKLRKLKDLVVSHCPFLEVLPAELGSLSLKRLKIDECPSLKTPPKEIQSRGQHAILAYLRRLQTGSVMCKRTKLMLVGLGGAGKTSVVKALVSSDGKAHLESGAEITDGIDISNWTVGEDDDAVTFSVWDFAGQTVYYNTHQFFLSDRAIYMLMWNMRLGFEHAGLDFWLSSIMVHAPNAPVIVVGTHSDQVSKWELPTAEIKRRYPAIENFCFVSSYTGENIADLKTQLHKIALSQSYMGESIPEVWLNFEKAVVERRNLESVITYDEIEKIAIESGIFEKPEIGEAVQFLHELGTLQHFNNVYLKDKVVIDPQWIVDVMACVVSVKDSPIQDGKFYQKHMSQVWRDYPENLHKWLLRLTEEYDLTFPLPDHPVNLVPCLLPDKHSGIDWPEVDPSTGIRETKMLYKFDYLPAGLFNRAQVRLYQYSDSSQIWKTGSVLKKNGNMALVTQTKNCEMLVKVQGPRPENILFMIHEVFEGLIAESFHGVKYDYLFPCPDCLQTNPSDAYMFHASIIKRATELKAPFLQCTKHFHVVTLTDLHNVMPPDSSVDYDVQLATAVRNLTDLKKDLRLDIFISYCTKDLPGKQTTKVVDPRTIYKDLTNNGFKCFFPEENTATNIEQQALAMRDCKVFMALISDEYVTDPQCADMFQYAHMTLRKPLIMVTLGQGKNWRKSKIGILLSGEVFINMTQTERYQIKLDELNHMVKEKISDKNAQLHPSCFVSYCWSNSHEAIKKGSKEIQGALGEEDPREIKQYLEKKGVPCWLDVERVGRVGLFEDIADGLQHAHLMVACVSDEYASSTNCAMEFRFATSVLKLPTVLAIVGTGNNWRRTEVGMLSLQGPLPEVNFQDKSELAHEKLLQLVQERIPDVDGEKTESTTKQENEKLNEDQKNTSFQELYELAQRKLLRQISQYADNIMYPRLLVVDFLEMIQKHMEEENDSARTTPVQKPGLKRRNTTTQNKMQVDVILKQKGLGFKILCEHEEGWHSYADPLAAPPEFDESYISKFSPYLARITTLLKHSNQFYLNCVSGEYGESFVKWLDELPQATLSDFGKIYLEFRNEVMKADKNMTMGQLARCHLPSGKTIWLCPEHQNTTRMTLLTNDVILPSDRLTLSNRDGPMYTELLNTLTEGKMDYQVVNDIIEEESDDEPEVKSELQLQQEEQLKDIGWLLDEVVMTTSSERVKCVDIHPTKPWVLSALYFGKVQIWNFEKEKLYKTIKASIVPIRTAKFVIYENWIITGSDDKFIRVFNIETEEKVHELKAHNDNIRSIVVHPVKALIFSSSDDRTIKLWELAGGMKCTETFTGHDDIVTQITVHPEDWNVFATASHDKSIKIWSALNKDKSGFTLHGHDEGVNCVHFHPNEPLLISGGDDSLVKIWDYEKRMCLRTLFNHSGSINATVFLPDLPVCLSGGQDTTVNAWNIDTYGLEKALSFQLGQVWTLTFSSKYDVLAMGCDKGIVLIRVTKDVEIESRTKSKAITQEQLHMPQEQIEKSQHQQQQFEQSQQQQQQFEQSQQQQHTIPPVAPPPPPIPQTNVPTGLAEYGDRISEENYEIFSNTSELNKDTNSEVTIDNLSDSASFKEQITDLIQEGRNITIEETGNTSGTKNLFSFGNNRANDTREDLFSFGSNRANDTREDLFSFGPSTSQGNHRKSEDRMSAQSSASSKQSRVRERTRQNIERDRTKAQLKAVSSAANKAALAERPQSNLCNIL